MFVFVILGLLVCIEAEGDIREESLYVETGTDLLLNVREPVTLKEDDTIFWKFNSTLMIVRLTHTNEPEPFWIYTARAELFPQNQSLLLKNVQKTDSGEYKAEIFGTTIRVLVKYQVTVLDPVSDVKLEVKQCSSDRSDLTVTCTTLDALLSSTFICENTTCSHEGGEKNIPPGASVKVYLKKGSVTCHHSNQVSSKEDTKTVEELCGKDPVSDVKLEVKQSNQASTKEDTKTVEDLCGKPDVPDSSSAGVSLCMLKIIIVSVGLFIMVSAVISVHVMEKLNKTE